MTLNPTTHPKLFAEWHPELNGDDSLENYTHGSNMKPWWQCPIEKDHVWRSPISDRANKSGGCPFCSGYRIALSNSLGRDKESLLYKEYNIDKNTQRPDELHFRSMTKVWWKCLKRQHEWVTSVSARQHGQNCPYCSHRKTAPEDSLAILYPEVTKFFNEEKTGKPAIELSPGSNKKVWWNCETGNPHHVHEMEIRNKTGVSRNRTFGCPYCSNRRVNEHNNLAVVDPVLASEFHPTKNTVLATKIPAGYAKKVWWQCIKGHEWEAAPSTRTYAKTQCPQCCEWNSSRNEDLFREVVIEKEILLNIEESRTSKLNIHWGKRKTMFVDIVGTLKNSGKQLAIEYDGAFYHYKDDVVERDIRKTQALLDAGYIVVRIRENKLSFVNIQHKNLFQINHKASLKIEKTRETVDEVFNWLKISNLL